MVRLCQERDARLVISGTFSEYQRPFGETLLREESPLETRKIYGASKAAGGIVASALAVNLRVSLRYLRFFHVYGAGEASHRLLPNLVAGLASGNRVALSAGTQVRDFVYVKDAVEACIKASEDMLTPSRPPTAIWNICTGIGTSVRAFARETAQAMGAPATLLGFGDLPMRADDEPYLVGDGGRATSELGWQPKFGLAEGIAASLTTNARVAV
jgi:nucleoside-diphosphate-sugar epimerase